MHTIDLLNKYQQQLNNIHALLQRYPILDTGKPALGVAQDSASLYFGEDQAAMVGATVGKNGWTAVKEYYGTSWNWHKLVDNVKLVLLNMDRTEEVKERPVLPTQFPIQIMDQAAPVDLDTPL